LRGAVRARARDRDRGARPRWQLRRQAVPGPRLQAAHRGGARALRDPEDRQACLESPDLDRAVRDRQGLPRAGGARSARSCSMSTPLRLVIDRWGEPSPRKIAAAVEVLHRGGVAAYPTDSIYALGCAIEARDAIERIYRA